MTEPSSPSQRYQPHRHVPYYEGPPAGTFQPQPQLLPARRSRVPFVTAVVGGIAAVCVGAAVVLTRPWHHDPASLAVSPVAHASASRSATPQPHERPSGAVLEHTYVENFLVDLEDATAPVCNGGADVAAKVGRVISCVEGAQRWTVRITEVDADGAVRWELVN